MYCLCVNVYCSYYCHRVETQLQLNIHWYHIIVIRLDSVFGPVTMTIDGSIPKRARVFLFFPLSKLALRRPPSGYLSQSFPGGWVSGW